jgi:probable HAF family extracellular repeat protein
MHLEVLEDRCLLSTYTLTDVGMLAEGPDTYGTGLNNLGQVVGYSFPHQRAFLWDSGKLTELDTLGGDSNGALGINDSGQVVGWSTLDPGDLHTAHPFLWDGTQGPQDLGTLGGAFSGASAINNAGQVVGAAGNAHAFLWQDGTLTDLFPGGRYSSAQAINRDGDVVGLFNDPIGDQHAAIWYGGVPAPQDLGTLPGRETSIARGVNDADFVVGWALSPDRAFLWGGGSMIDLGTLEPDGFGLSGADAINNAGQVVGWSTIPGSVTHAFVWSYGGVMSDLNDLVPKGSGLTLKEATAINDAGQIAADARDADGHQHAVLLTPDAGAAPHAVDPGLLRLPALFHEAPAVGASTGQPPPSALRERAAAETMTLPVGAAVQRATDSVFAGSHRTATPAPEGVGEVEGLESALPLIPPR